MIKPHNLPASEIDAAQIAGNDLATEFLAFSQRDPQILDFISTCCLDGIWYWDLEDPERGWISPRFWEFLGYDPATRAPRRAAWLEVLHPDDRGAAQRNYDRLLADPDHPFDQIFRYFRADGSLAWMRCRGMALRRQEGRPTRMLGVNMDVTALKLAEHDVEVKAQALKGAASELTRREQELQFIFDNLPLRIWYKDERNRILHLNEPARKAMEAGDIHATADEEEREEDAEIMTSWTAVTDISEKADPASGRDKWVRTDKIPYFDRSLGRRTLLIVETDIPRPLEKRAETGRQQAERELWRRYYTDLYCRVPAIMHSVGTDGRLAEVSDQWLESTGYSREEVIGRNASEFFVEHSALGDKGITHPLSARGGAVAVPCRLKRKAGPSLPVELSSVMTMNPVSGTAHELVLAADVSERNAAFEENARLSATLEVLHDRMDRSIKAAAEQLREPLRRIEAAGAAMTGDSGAALEGEAASLAETIGGTVRWIDRLSDDMLAYSAVLNRPLRMGGVNLHSLIRSVIAELRPVLDAAGGRILLGPCPVITADRDMVEQLFRKLLASAIEFRHPERPLLVNIACTQPPRAAATFCTVRDNGVGFDPDLALTIFEPFVSRRRDGTAGTDGLGLALCKAVCERHGWSIWAEEAGDQGSAFTIRFPDVRLAGRPGPRSGPAAMTWRR